ncbi:hypothetical protein F383_04421 [Gossypium arboreum]|uniref:Uncharacterized protein n=1 Tax=Gossypium arboreum TaxID=29729 RepID=A0A0B0PBC7_GOSAR|nr:hypothetical protein F383_04421 [Gossypium arboreum]
MRTVAKKAFQLVPLSVRFLIPNLWFTTIVTVAIVIIIFLVFFSHTPLYSDLKDLSLSFFRPCLTTDSATVMTSALDTSCFTSCLT